MIRNNLSRSKRNLSFGFGSPYVKNIQKLKLMQKFPDGSVYQVMPPTSVEEEILKGTTNGDISSAYPNKDTLPPNLTQEGKGDYFEVKNYDFTIEEGKEDSNLNSGENNNITMDSASGSDIVGEANIPDDQVSDPDNESPSERLEDNGETQGEEKWQSDSEEDQTTEGMLEYTEVENQSEDPERLQIEKWFKIIE